MKLKALTKQFVKRNEIWGRANIRAKLKRYYDRHPWRRVPMQKRANRQTTAACRVSTPQIALKLVVGKIIA